jgi:branched-chain amino acid aminotransferase
MAENMDIQVQKVSKSRAEEVLGGSLSFGKHFSDHMFVADFKDGHWSSGEIVPFGPLPMSPGLSAIHYGQAIFEGLKAYKNEQGEVMVFRPLDNLKRMNESAKRMYMPVIQEHFFVQALKKLIDIDREWVPQKEGHSLYIRPVMFATDETIGVRPSDNYKFVIFTSPSGLYFSEKVRLLVETTYTRASEGGVGFAKAAGNYGVSMFPTKMAQEKGYHQIIWTDAANHEFVEEAGTMNIVFITGDKLITPAAGSTILAGVTRDSVLSIARAWGMEVEERPLRVSELISLIRNNELSEAFGTGTAALPVPDSGSFSVRLSKYLSDIRMGKEEDIFGWMLKV